MKMLFTLAWRNLWRNRKRSLITVSSVLFAVFFAVLMRSFQLGSYALMIENMVGAFTGYAQVQHPKYKDDPSLDHLIFPDDSLQIKLLNLTGVEDAVPRIQQFALFSHADNTRGGLFIGLETEREINGLQLDKRLQTGRLFSNPTAMEIVLTEGLAEVLELGVGDSVVLISQGYRGQSAYGLYPVVGTVKLASPELNRSMAFLPLEEARYLLGAAGSATQVVLKMNNEEADDKWLAEAAFVIDTANYRLYGWKELMPELVQAISADSAGGIIMIIILYMVIAFGLMGTVLMMTAERQHEFGVLVALGMKRNQLALMTALESVLLTLIGSIAGLLLAAPVVTYFYLHPIEFTGQMAETMLSYGMEPLMPASIKPSIALFNAGSVVLISLLCALYPVVKIRHLQPVKAMRS